jgi:hypothetical protein
MIIEPSAFNSLTVAYYQSFTHLTFPFALVDYVWNLRTVGFITIFNASNNRFELLLSNFDAYSVI